MKTKISIILLALLLYNCQSNKETKVSFMTFNIYQEGTKVENGFTQIKNVILNVKPDVVGFTEVKNYSGDWTSKMQKVLEENGKKYYRGYVGGDTSILSKYPIKDAVLTGKNSISKFKIEVNTKEMYVAVAHLDYTQYACYLPRGYYGGTPNWGEITNEKGALTPVKSVDSILRFNLTSLRDEQLKDFVANLKDEEKPLILLGDFNEPSHLDWQKNTKNLYDHNGLIVNWQNSLYLKNKGFVDSYREKYPNAVKNPGFTWPSEMSKDVSTSWAPKADERDRIDFIYYLGDAISVEKTAMVGSKNYFVRNKKSSENVENDVFLASDLPWPSDHKAVFATLVFKN
ncbi:endonuclease/exonuclease/phosphatase family protein [Polaribacter batillariae]|uniref:Endonuclease/exonuclease/phosphatase family protein n=1 Tax=Polaribacter batillariae TaxID=2808900 RepID=A0ABX7SWW4_9FLAO|nr:endonuclease/exonuclease/phosphatase family protein [Polaribacter batillariae]QTD37986.1 endonuclease/exonuclease/phosphatase family protein [Polaribacter batillariae]